MHLWPYVNGKGLSKGLRLMNMEASEMLDVVSYFFEEDYINVGMDGSKYKDTFRTHVYRQMYDMEYEYSSSSDETSSQSEIDIDGLQGSDEPVEIIEPFNPRAQKVKNFIEPTEVSDDNSAPFGSLLDEPLG